MENEDNKPTKVEAGGKKPIGMIAGIAAAVVIIVVAVVLVVNATKYNTIEKVQKAFRDKKSISCTVTKKDDDDKMVIKMNKGRTKIFMQQSSGEDNPETTLIVDKVAYSWGGSAYGDEKSGMKMELDDDSLEGFNSSLDDIFGNEDTDSEADDDYEFDCRSSKDSDFKVPEDIEFTDISELMNGLGGGYDDDYDWDDDEDYGDSDSDFDWDTWMSEYESENAE